MNKVEIEIGQLAARCAKELKKQTDARVAEMDDDDRSHYLLYNALGVSDLEGDQIDIYQNKGRFLYRYAGTFLESATKLCFKHAFPDSGVRRIENTRGDKPKMFEIDCLVGNDALEIKWRDATTDGDHITKEHNRIRVISDAGYVPIRVMFYFPNRGQAAKIQAKLEKLYQEVGGQYYHGEDAWEYVRKRTDVNLKAVIARLGTLNQQRHGGGNER